MKHKTTPSNGSLSKWRSLGGLLLLLAILGYSSTVQAVITLEHITPSFIRHPLDSAYLVCKTLKNSDEKASLMREVAIKYAISGDTGIAFQIGLELQKTFPESPYSKFIFPEMGAALAQNGQRNDVMSLLSKITDNTLKQHTSEYVALAYIQQRQLDMAQSFIRNIDNTAKRTRLSLQLAEAYANDSFFQKAEELLKDIPPTQSKNQTLQTIALLAAKSHQINLSQLLLLQLTDPEMQANGLVDIVNIGSNNQQFPESLRIANSIIPAKHRAKALAYLAGNYAKYRLFTDAWTLTNGLSTDAKDMANSRIAKELGELGELPNATTALAQIKSQDYRFDAIMGICKGHVQEGNYEQAVQLVQDIKDVELRNKGLVLLAEMMGNTKQFHYVQLLIRQFRPNSIKDQAFSRYTMTFMRHAASSRVLRITEEISNTPLRNETLKNITDYYLNTGQFSEAKHSISALSIPEERHEMYLKSAQVAINNNNSMMAQEFLTSDLDKAIANIQDKAEKASALAEIAIQFTALQQTDKGERATEEAYNLVKGLPNWQHNARLLTLITNLFQLSQRTPLQPTKSL